MGNKVSLLIREDYWSSLGWSRSPILKVDLGVLENFDFQYALSTLKSSNELSEVEDFFIEYKDSMLVILLKSAGLDYRDLLFSIILKNFNKDLLSRGENITLLSGNGYDIVLSAETEEVK